MEISFYEAVKIEEKVGKMPNKAMQIEAVRAVRLHECSFITFYHANGHRIQRD